MAEIFWEDEVAGKMPRKPRLEGGVKGA